MTGGRDFSVIQGRLLGPTGTVDLRGHLRNLAKAGATRGLIRAGARPNLVFYRPKVRDVPARALHLPIFAIQFNGIGRDVNPAVNEHRSRILLLSRNPAQMDMLSRQAPAERFECVPCSDIEEALDRLEQEPFEVFVVDEELHDINGIDVLIQAREIEPYTTFVLAVDEELAIGVAADALNHADISRILLAPIELDEWVECCEQATELYQKNTRTLHHLNLSRAKVRRLRRTVEDTKRELRQKNRQIKKLRQSPVAPSPMSRPVSNASQDDGRLFEDISTLLTRIILAAPNGPDVERLRRLVEYCARKLGWPAREVRVLCLAATYHHALLPEYPAEAHNELRNTKARHAFAMQELLDALPGFGEIARIIGDHHGERGRRSGTKHPPQVSRSAKLLQILSLFDELMHDPEVQASEQCSNDPDYPLIRSSQIILRLATEGKLDFELSEACIKQLIPRMLKREETCLSAAQLRVDMQLSRTIYADNLPLIREMETLTPTSLDQIRIAHETQHFPGIWVVGKLSPTELKTA